jgi:hypothetical protein
MRDSPSFTVADKRGREQAGKKKRAIPWKELPAVRAGECVRVS